MKLKRIPVTEESVCDAIRISWAEAHRCELRGNDFAAFCIWREITKFLGQVIIDLAKPLPAYTCTPVMSGISALIYIARDHRDDAQLRDDPYTWLKRL